MKPTDRRRARTGAPPPVDPRVRAVVERVVRHVRPRRVILFGSRARGDGVSKSDIDLAVDAPGHDVRAWFDVMEDLDRDPPTLLSVDLIFLDQVDASFRAAIQREGRVLYERRAS